MGAGTAKTIAIAIAVVVIAIVALFIGRYLTSTTGTAAGGGTYIDVVDIVNRSVRIPAKVNRAVAIGPGVLRLVAYLDALDLIVGVEEAEQQWDPLGRDYAMAYADVFKTLPIVGPGGPRSPPDPERIRAVKPDVVLMSRIYVELYSPDRLSEEVGAPVVVVDYGEAGYLRPDSAKNALRLLGRILGREGRAEELCSYIDRVVEDLRKRTADIGSRPTVYVGAISYKGRQPFTSSQALFPPLILINTPSIADEVGQKAGFVSLDFEYILQRQPDTVFIDLNNLDSVVADFAKDPSKFCALKAFKEGRVYSILPFNYYHTNIATALADAYFMGRVLYPERFSDIEPVEKANEIYRAFLGRELYSMFVEGFGRGFGGLGELFRCG